jgi:uncharacterized protein (DUF111 family)
MKTLFLDCPHGATEGMLLGSLLDLGLKMSALEWELAKLNLPEHYHFHAERREDAEGAGIHFSVHEGSTHHAHACECGHDHGHGHEAQDPQHSHHDHGHGRNFAEIQALLKDSALSEPVKNKAIAVYRRIAEAEGRAHGTSPETAPLHAAGGLETLLGVVGFCAGLEKLGIQAIHAELPGGATTSAAALLAEWAPSDAGAEKKPKVEKTGRGFDAHSQAVRAGLSEEFS